MSISCRISWPLVLIIAITSCDRKLPGGNSSVRIKSIMESTHDPIKANGQVKHFDQVSLNSFITKRTFNTAGQIVREEKFDEKGIAGPGVTYKYDLNGNILEINLFHMNKPISKTQNKFDAMNTLLASTETDPHGIIKKQKKSSIDSSGNLVITTYKIDHNQQEKMVEVIFDSKHHPIKRDTFSNAQLVQSDYSEYDELGNRAGLVKQFPLKRDLQVFQYKYNKNNRLTELITADRNYIVQSRITYTFDKYGNVSGVFTYGTDGSLREVEKLTYQLDNNNNWIEKVIFQNDEPLAVVVRNIDYY